MSDPREGKVLQGRYRLMSLIAEGGMGVVYKGERVGIGRSVVVKFLHAVLSDKPGIVDRFEREARATARLNHPNCVGLVDFGIDEGAPYLVMEYVEGQTLADLLDHGAVKPERAVDIVRQILAGLQHAHDRGILHRDLKPANVMIVETEGYPGDFVKILDFGLAKLALPGEDKRDVTVEGIAIGTPGYMSPEQAAGVPSDRRSDIYCTGALLYHLVTGTKAFDGDDVRSVLRRHREETPASPRALTPAAGISRELEEIIGRAMQRDPSKRFQSAPEMAVALINTPEAKQKAEMDARRTSARPPKLPGVVDRGRDEVPGAASRERRSSGAALWLTGGLAVGAALALAAVVYSPLGAYVHPQAEATAQPDPQHEVAASPPPPAQAKPPAEAKAPEAKPAAEAKASAEVKPPAAAPAATTGTPTATATADAPPSGSGGALAPGGAAAPAAASEAARPATATADDEDEEAKVDDGSNEDDRTPPPAPAGAPRREAASVRNLGDVRALMRRGDMDGALSGLYRLRRGKQSSASGSQIAILIGNLYFDRKWWTDALREYRFAITLEGRARKDEYLIVNSVHALSDKGTYARARRLIIVYVGKSAVPALRRAAKSGATQAWRQRAQKVLSSLDSRAGRSHAAR
jgi:serine/threonine-protein kinase